ncbi:hypothetical protein COJ48_00345 [Bacillus cereus]|uniref:DUF72 domain-containing protein n=1 Tax=Bacillus paramycoides TaxID=2026194 RepID=A0ABU6MYD7_9BACI|nr:DUF72 domain-containing protein [Bacillus paramycoides]PFD43902.1 hypothetical protein CN285_07150 [Bacillus cereus]MED0964906.1 DUF72 domain-containing protein [Bacillus paramycoides]MED0970278.1 DUF72 domain-containing protein [Bacillus paramycoides]MED0980648.1 DUF72 domain-containing protein [Bacillus paramycoides]MED0985721.1 DUF72 domain-containing protein [Bacillus paramycoides]
MLYIGVTGWGDHDSLYINPYENRNKLRTYSGNFPIVEVDSSFYAIQPARNYTKWAMETPKDFSFIVKAYQGMTGHMKGEIPFSTFEEMFDVYKQSILPLKDANKLKMILFQYPPWFDCKKKNVDLLRYTKEKMEGFPCAIEFRNQTWFYPEMRDKTLQFLEREKWIHTICDEPQAGIGSVPLILEATNSDMALIRFHGRNVHGWLDKGENWRAVRCLYRYNNNELEEWVERLEQLKKKAKDIYVLFNNNSGGDAADNAKQLMEMMSITYGEPKPEQLNLFE